MVKARTPAWELKIGSNSYKLLKIDVLNFSSRINKHAVMNVKASLSGEKSDFEKILEVDRETQVTLLEKTTKETVSLFVGLVSHLNLDFRREIICIEMTVVSNTYTCDIKRDEKRAFQNKETTYGDLVDAVAGAGVCSTGDYADESIEEFALQYKETDWEFLIRMASRAGTGLVADYTSEKPKFKFVEEIDEGSFNIDDDRLISVSKSIVGGKEKMSYFFALEKGYEKGDDTRDCFIGSKFNYTGENISNSNLLCKSLEANIIEGAIIYTVELSDDLSEEEIFNDKISGVSLKCKVLANDGSDDSLAKLKVKIEDFEDEDSQNPILFPYATLYAANDHGGWFFMPEEDDTVMLYFPNNKEKNAFCTCSRREKDLPDNITPETKIISAPNGKIIEINEDEISIASSENTFIRMSKDSVEIRSDKPLKIETGDDLTMESRGKIVIQSEAGIDLSASGSSIKMAANVDLEGSNVKIS